MWKIGLGIGIILFLLTGCYDSKVNRLRLELMEQQIQALEEWQEQFNRDIAVLQELVEALMGKKTIVSVTQSPEGYTFLLSDQSILEVFHGKNGVPGEDGVMVVPRVSVRDSSDGHVYWTINGEVWKNEAGQGMRADGVKGQAGDAGKPGEQGEAGIVPQVRINPQTEFWEISADGGSTWNSTGIKATGEQGDSGQPGIQGPEGESGAWGNLVFKQDGIRIQDKYVEFDLRDGTTFRLPRGSALSLRFPSGQSVRVPLCVEKIVPFVIEGATEKTTVEAAGDAGWLAEVRMDAVRSDSGVIVITAPEVEGKGTVLVILTDGEGGCWTAQIRARALPTSRMIRIPGGNLEIIGPHGAGWSLTEYWMGETEVTCQQYCDFLNEQDTVLLQTTVLDTIGWLAKSYKNYSVECVNGHWQPVFREVFYSSGNRIESMADYPMSEATSAGALAYCRWAGGCLPTRAQWEYAARGGDQNPYARTEKYSGSDNIDEVAWYCYNCDQDGSNLLLLKKGTHPVKGKKPNFLGLYDMTGNEGEFTREYWKSTDSYPCNGRKPYIDPQGGGPSYCRVWCDGDVFGDNLYFYGVDRISCLSLFSRGGFRLAFEP